MDRSQNCVSTRMMLINKATKKMSSYPHTSSNCVFPFLQHAMDPSARFYLRLVSPEVRDLVDQIPIENNMTYMVYYPALFGSSDGAISHILTYRQIETVRSIGIGLSVHLMRVIDNERYSQPSLDL